MAMHTIVCASSIGIPCAKEQHYLTSLKQPSPDEQFKIQYIQILDELEECK